MHCKNLKLVLLIICVLAQGFVFFKVANGDVTKDILYIIDLNDEQFDESEIAERVALFVQTIEENKDQKVLQRHLRFMNSLQAEADMCRINADNGKAIAEQMYFKAQNRYYEAALYYPRSLLIFKYSEMQIRDILRYDEIPSTTLRKVLNDYQIGLELYKYEPENDKSLSMNCYHGMQQKINCYREKYLIYKNNEGSTIIPNDQILRCMYTGPDVFQYENYCQ